MNSDWENFIQAQNGDEKAWRKLVNDYQAKLSALAIMVTGSVTVADDIVQETFIRALKAKIKNKSGTVKGFLGTITYRLAVKEEKRQQKNIEIDKLDLHEQDHNPLEKVLKEEQDRLVVDAIRKLDSEHRDVILLRLYAGHSYEEIANQLLIPLGTVKSRIYYAVRSCRKTLQQMGVINDTH